MEPDVGFSSAYPGAGPGDTFESLIGSEDATSDIIEDIDPNVVLDYWGNVYEPEVELWYQIVIIVLNWASFAYALGMGYSGQKFMP